MRRWRALVSLTNVWYHSSAYIPPGSTRLLSFLSIWNTSTSESISGIISTSASLGWYVFHPSFDSLSLSQPFNISCWE